MSEIIITNLITSISTLGASFIGGYFMYKSNQKKDKLDKITNYELENEYIKELQILN